MSHRTGVLGWPGRVPHVVKYALSYLFAQSEFGLLCPVNMTDSTSRMLRRFGSEELKARYLPRLTTTEFDALWQGTQWMTEKTGGSDVGASTTVARRDADGTWRLWGDKWFCSNANADMALTLARPEGAPPGTRGLGDVPRAQASCPTAPGTRGRINRLKDKLGSRSMATGEVTLAGAVAYVVGDLARGFEQMMEMVNVSRLSNAMRAAGDHAPLRCWSRSCTRAAARPSAAPWSTCRCSARTCSRCCSTRRRRPRSCCNAAAHARPRATPAPRRTRALVRIVTPLAKYWITARARVVAGEAMNVRGGNGYVEEWVNARLLRDAYLGAIWEGSTNVVALDVQRAIAKDGGLEPLAALRGRAARTR